MLELKCRFHASLYVGYQSTGGYTRLISCTKGIWKPGYIKINIFLALLIRLWLSLFATIYEHVLIVMFAVQPTRNLT